MPSQCRVSYSDVMTSRGTPGRMVRIEDSVWADYGKLCEEEGTSRADDLRRHAHARVAAWKKKQAMQGAVERRLKNLDSD